jgi:glycosyltransferase involved in cell wall biosynthesis/Tfp pilus assembly protein PilF
MQSWAQYYERRTNFDEHVAAPHIRRLLGCIVKSWQGGEVLEVGCGTGFLSIWLSRIGIPVTAIDRDPDLIAGGKAANGALGASVNFMEGDAFTLCDQFEDRQFEIIFHQGVLEHFTDDDIRKLMQQQLQIADKVLFSVPSAFYPQQDFGDERLMTLEEWREILEPFAEKFIDAEYHGHQAGGQEELFMAIAARKEDAGQRAPAEPVVQAANPTHLNLEWHSDIFHHSGYAHHARTMLLGMEDAGVKVAARTLAGEQALTGDYDAKTWERLTRMVNRKSTENGIFVVHHPPVTGEHANVFANAVRSNPGHKHYIGSTVFETDRIPVDWVPACNNMDEIWVQNRFNFNTFSASGVDQELMHILPSGLDTRFFDPEKTAPVRLKGGRSFNFISIFEWTKRKGWDVLLKAYFKEFDYREDVALTLFVYRGGGTSQEEQQSVVDRAMDYMVHELGVDPEKKPFINIVQNVFPNYVMPQLYKAADAFVLPTRGEGWGIPYMEAMAMELPTIGTNWGGNTEFMQDSNSYLIDIDGLELVDDEQVRDNNLYRGHQWAAPSVESTRRQMREVFENRLEAQERGKTARQDIINNWSQRNAGEKVAARLDEIAQELDSKKRRPVAVDDAIPACHLHWEGPLSDPSGYAEEGRNIALGLDESKAIQVSASDVQWNNRKVHLKREKQDALDNVYQRNDEPVDVHVSHIFPPYFRRDPNARLNVGRTVFETNSLPEEWVKHCNAMDEIWVPTDFNMESFARAGVQPDKLVKIHQSLDTSIYDPQIAPLYVPGRAGFNFISIFDWSLRKGWDVLLQAFIEEFGTNEDVSLMMRTYSSLGQSTADIQQAMIDHIHKFKQADLPDVLLIDRMLSDTELIQFYNAGQAFVMPSRCEGWGRPLMEAMAMGSPTIGTRWSGNLEFMHDGNSLLLDAEVVDVPEAGYTEVPGYQGHQWAEPSVQQLRNMMRKLYEDRRYGMELGSIARKEMLERFSWSRITEDITAHLGGTLGDDRLHADTDSVGTKSAPVTVVEPLPVSTPERIETPVAEPVPAPIEQKSMPVTDGKKIVVWEGAQFVRHSLALVNRELCCQLLDDADIDLQILPIESDEFGLEEDVARFPALMERFVPQAPPIADVYIRHAWPPNFSRPECEKFIMIQPWEFGRIPKDWVEPLNTQVDELWVPSRYVQDCYTGSGVNPEKVKVIPNGVNMELFDPACTPLDLTTEKTFKFLFVGGTIWRKGIDTLLQAYADAFTADDDVCLVVKDMGQDSFYKGLGAAELIAEFKAQPNAPEILYVTDMLTQFAMPALYNACDALVHPYRGEGYGMPVAEAMAMALPVIVTQGGACDEICPTEFVYPVSASVAQVNLEFELAGQGWVLDPDVKSLTAQMRAVLEQPAEAKRRAGLAQHHVRSHATWSTSAALVRLQLASHEEAASQSSELATDTPHRSAQIAAEAGEFDKAAALYQELVETQLDDVNILVEYGSVLAQLSRLDDAEQQFLRAVELTSDSIDTLNVLGCFYFQVSQVEKAEATYQKILKKSPTNMDALCNLAHMYLGAERFRDAAHAARDAAKQDPHNIDMLRILAHSCYRLGEAKAALNLLQKVQQLAPDDPDVQTDIQFLQAKLQESSESCSSPS